MEQLMEFDIDTVVEQAIDFCTKNYADALQKVDAGRISKDEFINTRIAGFVAKNPLVPQSRQKEVLSYFKTTMWGYGKLEPFLYDESISDIAIYGPDDVAGKQYGKRVSLPVHFKNGADIDRYISRIAMFNKQDISNQNALPIISDITSNPYNRLRVNIITNYVTSVGHGYVQIRKIPKQKPSLERLIQDGYFTLEQARFIVQRFINKHGVVFCGAGGAGKTVGMNWLIDAISNDISGFFIQEADELFSNTHGKYMFTHMVNNSGDGKINYGLRALAQKGLLVDMDIFGIGEIKGPEAYDLVNAVYTGTTGLCSVHSFSSREALNKIVHYAKYVSDYSKEDLMLMLRHLDTIVFMDHYKVKEISIIKDYDYALKDYVYQTVSY